MRRPRMVLLPVVPVLNVLVGFRRERWPHGATGEAFGHAALFRP